MLQITTFWTNYLKKTSIFMIYTEVFIVLIQSILKTLYITNDNILSELITHGDSLILQFFRFSSLEFDQHLL